LQLQESTAAGVDSSILLSDRAGVTTGFQLSYRAKTGSYSRPERHVISTSTPYITVTHPISGNYTNRELSTFVYAPHATYDPQAAVKTTFNVKGMEPGHDFVFVYTLSIVITSVPGWGLQKR